MAKTKPARKATAVFTDEERAAMRDYVKERKGAAQGEDVDQTREVLAKIAAMATPDRKLGERLHAMITASAPTIAARLWYGMPAYAKDGKVVCHFQPAGKFKTRYATLGFSDKAALDDGQMWPVAFALGELTAADEARIRALVKKAVG
jgi:hypothetical protein